MRNTNLTGKNAEEALRYMRKNGIEMWPKLERELERNTEEYARKRIKVSSRHGKVSQ